MSIDWTMVAALATVASVVGIVWQTRCTTSIQATLQLLAAWDGSPMFPRIRHTAALNGFAHLSRLMEHQGATIAGIETSTPALNATAHIDSVLDFFETVAGLTRRHWYEWSRPLSVTQAYNSFYWPMACYWVSAKDYIAEAAADEGQDTWEEYRDLMTQFLQISGGEPSVQHALTFFEDEMARTGINTAV